MPSLTTWLAGVFFSALIVLVAYGLLGWFTLYLYLKVRHRVLEPAPDKADGPARVTVQIPVFNERLVVQRVIRAASRLEYPRERLQIQVVDDSTDDTTVAAAELVEHYRAQGVRIELVHRDHRAGYKAGALADALTTATGEYIVVFDADFEPPPDFLARTISCFDADPHLGLVQTRWAHRNSDASLLTAAQAISIDRHFAVEQIVRFGAAFFPKFNGSAGIWRRACIEDAGGWRGDTLCEDLCLSTRAFLEGWRFRLLPDVAVSAEIPDSISGFKNQQARWAQGSIQCLVQYGRAILAARRQPLAGRLYALLIMSGYVTALTPILMLLSLVPLVSLGWKPPAFLWWMVLAAASHPLLQAVSQRALYPQWRRRMIHLLSLLIVALGTSPAISRGVLRGATGRRNAFARTVKGQLGWRVYPQSFDWLLVAELLLAAYAAVGLIASALHQTLLPIPFFLACVVGFGYVGLKGLREQRPSLRTG